MKSLFQAFLNMIADRSGLTSTEYSTMGGAMAGTISDISQNLAGASNSAFDAVTSSVTAVTG